MNKAWLYIAAPALALAGLLIWLLAAGNADAAAVRKEVVRFHVVAASDSTADQQLKLKVRNGVFALVERLFADCETQEQALATARANGAVLEQEAERILQQNGCAESVTVEIGDRWFPTKAYGGLSFPAGRYQAVSIRIGAAEGENFWCVLYPALCIAPAVADERAEDELAAVVGEERTDFLKKSNEKQQIKFALAEWWAKISKKFK